MVVQLEKGPQHLLIMDENGNTAETKFYDLYRSISTFRPIKS